MTLSPVQAAPARDTLARRFVSLDTVASELDVSADTAWELIRSGRLPAIRIGGSQWRVERSVLTEFASAASPVTRAAAPVRPSRGRTSHAVTTRKRSLAPTS